MPVEYPLTQSLQERSLKASQLLTSDRTYVQTGRWDSTLKGEYEVIC